MRIYISATSSVSPQPTFDQNDYLQEILPPGQEYFSAIEPDYKAYIDPKLARRMARIIKMSIAATQKCLETSGIAVPEAIIVGTGFGCLQDTERFLADLVENNEGLLSPTAFIQSTHNTIAGQIALTLGCTNHNFTYVQRGHSFESALQDAILQVEEGISAVLVGGVDEVTPTVNAILNKTGCTSPASGENPLLSKTGNQPVSGEGASFFMLSSHRDSNTHACLEGHRTFYTPSSEEEIQDQVKKFLSDLSIDRNEVDAVLMGCNGYEKDDQYYELIGKSFFEGKAILSFKNLCGEYFTASSFGHHLAVNMLHQQRIFKDTLISGEAPKTLNKILFYNHYKGKYHTLSLLSKCPPL